MDFSKLIKKEKLHILKHPAVALSYVRGAGRQAGCEDGGSDEK